MPTPANALNIASAGIVVFDGTSAFTADTVTNHGVLVGGTSNAITSLGVGATGTLLVGAATADPAFATSATGDFTFTSTTAGGTRTLTVSNTDNTNSASKALIQTTTGGASSGDALHTFTVSGVTNWSQGIDNSVTGDPYVLAASTALGTTNVMSATTAGAVSFVLGNVDITRSGPGATVSATISNTSNSANSKAALFISVNGLTTQDPYVSWDASSGDIFTAGIDNSDDGSFVICSGSAIGTNDVMRIDRQQIATNWPLQPAFLAYQGSTATDATGDTTAYTLGSTVDLTEVFDQGADFDPATGTFTAPVTGRYFLSGRAQLIGGTAITRSDVHIVTSNRTYDVNNDFGAGAVVTQIGQAISCLCDMDAADTATCNIQSTDTGGKIDDVIGSATVYTAFSGYLAC